MKWTKHDDTHGPLWELHIFHGTTIWADCEMDGTYTLTLETRNQWPGEGKGPRYLTIPLGDGFANATQAKRAAEAWVKEVGHGHTH